MTDDWVEGLDPETRDEFDRYVEHARRKTTQEITGSAAFISIAPRPEELDVKFCLELGLAIMLDKPIIVVAFDDRDVPERLRRVADRVVETDIDTEAGARKLAEAINEIVE